MSYTLCRELLVSQNHLLWVRLHWQRRWIATPTTYQDQCNPSCFKFLTQGHRGSCLYWVIAEGKKKQQRKLEWYTQKLSAEGGWVGQKKETGRNREKVKAVPTKKETKVRRLEGVRPVIRQDELAKEETNEDLGKENMVTGETTNTNTVQEQRSKEKRWLP